MAVDASGDGMRKVAARAARKPAKGGAPNLVLLQAELSAIGAPLTACADEVTVMMPWAGLLLAAAGIDANGLACLRALCRPGARLRAVLSYDPARDTGVPEAAALDNAWITGALERRYREQGFERVDTHAVSMDELRTIPTTWAKRLGFGPARPVWRIDATA